jgi:class 3 adenylate cyclase
MSKSPGSAGPTGPADEAEVIELVLAPLRQRLAGLEARDSTDLGVLPLRQVSVLFVDVVDSTRLLRSLDAEDGHDVLDGALRRFGAAVHEHGGRVLRYTGDGLKAVFGMPEPAEDDAVRAVRAGLEMLRQAQDHAAEVHRRYGLAGFALRAGIHTGPVAVGAGAEDAHTLVGATVHLAARLEQNAAVGALCISHDTWTAVRARFDVEAQAPLDVEGLEAPVASYRVQCERSAG